MDKKQRLQIINCIGDLIEDKCKPCEHHGKATNQTICIGCEHGKELRRLGLMLESKHPVPVIKKKEEEPMILTVERFEELKAEGKSDKLIAKLFEMDHNAMYRFKKQHGLINKPNVKKEKKKEPKEIPVASNTEYTQIMNELKQKLSEEHISVNEQQQIIADLKEELSRYEQANEEAGLKYKQLEHACEDLETENEKLRKENERLMDLDTRAYDEENKEIEILREQVQAYKQALKVSLA